MSEGGDLSFILGVRITTSKGRRVLDQEHFVKAVLERFNMQNVKPVATPLEAGALEMLTMTMAGDKEKNGEGGIKRYQEAIGSLMWLATMTRPDLAFTVSFLSRFVASPSAKH
ncbi:MAG: hypothetical protein BJ554DRAFT_3686 [Olpidium bornovanus]|uniref:Reverse transcriptase Ty1/copia-type domain-containing protein n=1 Tax=Olpidium bornovanus TaxID=278681 RepID=A0A8H8DG25_9FUNG|nr:MAG: hypothetical protein BJ554DRAFT_3686 [Olpidium bornovanus]